MEINQLIADLQEISQKNSISHYKRDRCADAATALSTLQAENEKLRAELEQKSKLITQQAEELERRDTLLKEQEDELEQVKRCIEIVEHQRDEAIYDMTALMAGQCCDLCAVEYCNNRGKTEMCTAFKWRARKRRTDNETTLQNMQMVR